MSGGSKVLNPASGITKKVFGGSVGKVLDPGNVFGGRPGGMSMANMIDPGGFMVEEFTGSSIGRDLADPMGLIAPGGMFGDPIVPEMPSMTGENAMPSLDHKSDEAAAAANRRRAKGGGGRASTILSSNSLSEPTIGTTQLLGR